MTHLRIENQNSNVEIVNAAIIQKLYNLALGIEENLEEGESLSDYVSLKGNLQSDKCRKEAFDYLTDKFFPDLSIIVTVGKYLSFEDPEVEQRVIAWFFDNKQDTNGVLDNELTIPSNYLVARRDIIPGGGGKMFERITNVYKFNELSLFPNVTELPQDFAGGSSLQEIDLSNIQTLKNHSFAACTSLKSVNLSSLTDTNNEGGWFDGCTALETVILGSSLTTISDLAFKGCSSLSSIDLSNITSIGGSAFQGCTGLTSIDLSNVTTIGSSAFQGCSNLTTVSLPSLVTNINGSVFKDCSKLSTINLSNITNISGNAFENCSTLNNISLPSITTIGGYAFYNCTGISKVEIGPNLTTLGAYAFQTNQGVLGINPVFVFSGTTPPSSVGTNVFFGSWAHLYVPDGYESAYQTAFTDQRCTIYPVSQLPT